MTLPLETFRADIQRVSGRRNLSLEVRGTVLLVHEHAWAGNATLFVPVEWVKLDRHTRYKVDSLWRAIALLIVACLFVAMIAFCLSIPRSYPYDSLMLLLGVMAIACVCAAAFCVVHFFEPRATTIMTMSTEHGTNRVEFWHTPGTNAALDDVVSHIESLQGRIKELAPFPVHSSHTWYRMRPLRAVVTKGIAISVVLYAPVIILDAFFPGYHLVLFLLAPPLYHLARYGVSRVRVMREPKAFRAAVRSYNQGEPAQAKEFLDSMLGEHPRHIDALMLATYANIELEDFSSAFEHCRALALADPELADDFIREVWAIKRVHDRMNAAV